MTEKKLKLDLSAFPKKIVGTFQKKNFAHAALAASLCGIKNNFWQNALKKIKHVS